MSKKINNQKPKPKNETGKKDQRLPYEIQKMKSINENNRIDPMKGSKKCSKQ
jgi:hypothetical protein